MKFWSEYESVSFHAIFFFVTEEDGVPAASSKKEWIMNPKGKSYVCILHEYVQHALKKQPKYVFKEVGEWKSVFLFGHDCCDRGVTTLQK